MFAGCKNALLLVEPHDSFKSIERLISRSFIDYFVECELQYELTRQPNGYIRRLSTPIQFDQKTLINLHRC